MVLTISQQTYDDAVRELMEELEISCEEAIEEANKQFKAQGVDLSRIVKNLEQKPGSSQTHLIEVTVNQLQEIAKDENKRPLHEYTERLSVVRRECDKGIEFRVLAGKGNAYSSILSILLKNLDDEELMKDCLKTLISLMTKQPDLLDTKGVEVIGTILENQKDPEIQRLTLKWVKECCIMHEMNRQAIFDADILGHLKPLLNHADSFLLRDVLGVLRALVLDDDVRVEFGKAHDHAKIIAGDTLRSITSLLSNFKGDEPLMNDIMLTIAALLVRQEFCQAVEEAGGIDIIKEVLMLFHDNEKLIRQSFKMIKALCGSDTCKINFIEKGAAPLIISALDENKSSRQSVAAGFGAIAALTLRAANNSNALFNAGAPEVIIDCMTLHKDDINVQKNGSWAIRNMVSRSRHQIKKFLSLGIEKILQNNLKKFPTIEFDIKSALRDLGCKVEFKEEWTGKGGLLTSQASES